MNAGTRHRRTPQLFYVLSGFLLLLLIWWLATIVFQIAATTLPSPIDAIVAVLQARGIFRSLWVTIETTLLALLISVVIGVFVALILSESMPLEKMMTPVLVALQVVPIVVLAPVVMVSAPFGSAQTVVAVIVAFFPITISTLHGLKSVPAVLRDAIEVYPVSRWQRLYYLRWPFALPYFFTGLRTGAGLALVGAIIADMMTGRGGQFSGIGMRIQSALQSRPELVFGEAILVTLAGIGLLGTVDLLSRACLKPWRQTIT